MVVLYEKVTKCDGRVFQTDYAWASDGVIFTHRAVAPLGNLPTAYLYEGSADLNGKTASYLLQFEGWSKSRRKIRQEYLEKGWLV